MPIYNSATDGRIELSFKGKALLMVERDSAVRAISEQDFNANNQGLSRARAALARYMGELEAKIDVAVAQLSEKIPDQRPYAGMTATATMSGGPGNFQNLPRADFAAARAYREGRDTGFDVGRRFGASIIGRPQDLYDIAKLAGLATSYAHGLQLVRARALESIDLPKPARKKRKAKKVIRKSKHAYKKARRAK